VGALTADREATTVTEALVAADLHLALDVLGDIATEVTFDLGFVSMWARSWLTSSSVRSRTRVLGSMPVAAQISSALDRPMP